MVNCSTIARHKVVGVAVIFFLVGVPASAQEDYQETLREAEQRVMPKHKLVSGSCYANGQGVAQDDAEALRWFRLAAEQGFAAAQFNLGFMYANGRGVAQDDAEALRWYHLAAEQGVAEAQRNLGGMYANGRDGARDEQVGQVLTGIPVAAALQAGDS